MNNIWISLVSYVCLPAYWLDCGRNFNVGAPGANFSPKFFDACYAYGHHLNSTMHFNDLDLGWGPQGHCKARSTGFIFLPSFKLIRMRFDVVLKQFKLLLSQIH